MRGLGPDDVIERLERFGVGEGLDLGPRVEPLLQAGQRVGRSDEHDARRHRPASVPAGYESWLVSQP